jgi:hypothetical protein
MRRTSRGAAARRECGERRRLMRQGGPRGAGPPGIGARRARFRGEWGDVAWIVARCPVRTRARVDRGPAPWAHPYFHAIHVPVFTKCRVTDCPRGKQEIRMALRARSHRDACSAFIKHPRPRPPVCQSPCQAVAAPNRALRRSDHRPANAKRASMCRMNWRTIVAWANAFPRTGIVGSCGCRDPLARSVPRGTELALRWTTNRGRRRSERHHPPMAPSGDRT